MDRRSFFKRTVGTLTAALLFKRSVEAGTQVITVGDTYCEPGDIFHVPRTKENFIVSSVSGGKVTFSRPLANTVRSDDELILIGNVGGNQSWKNSWLETERYRRLYKGEEFNSGEKKNRR